MKLRNKLLTLGVLCAVAVPQVAGAEGFAIVESSAETVGMGGARMFAEDDAANVATNPASLTKNHGTSQKMGAVYISPHGHSRAYKDGQLVEEGHNRVRPAWAPHFYYSHQIDDKQWFAVGLFARFGLISEFESSSVLSTNATLSKMSGLSITPTYARKFDDKWSAAVGLDFNRVELELHKNLNLGPMGTYANQVEGRTWGTGWNIAGNYSFDDKNEIGLVYRSKISHTMDANLTTYGLPPALQAMGGYSRVHGKVTLPDSYTIGYNHKFNDKTRVELQGMYTRWSTYDKLNIKFDTPVFDQPGSYDTKNWSNGWRYAVGVEHKLSDKYTMLAGIAYDASVIPDEHADCMVPTGARRTYSLGAQYHDKQQTVALTLGWMDINGISITAKSGDRGFDHAHTYDNSAKVVAFSYERRM